LGVTRQRAVVVAGPVTVQVKRPLPASVGMLIGTSVARVSNEAPSSRDSSRVTVSFVGRLCCQALV
jgi:hypothetical protein